MFRTALILILGYFTAQGCLYNPAVAIDAVQILTQHPRGVLESVLTMEAFRQLLDQDTP